MSTGLRLRPAILAARETLAAGRAQLKKQHRQGESGTLVSRQLAELMDRHTITAEHVYGHAGHPENERCDRLAVAAAKAAVAHGNPPDLDPGADAEDDGLLP